MTTRPSTGSHICLSCQRHLAKRSYSNFKRTAPVLSSTDNYAVQSKRIEMLAARELAHRRLDKISRGITEQGGLVKGERSMKYKPGKRKTESVEDLQIPRLGEESKVIVLRDSLVTTYISDQVPHDISPVEPQHIDILGQLEDERGLVGDEDVQKHIEGFRPTAVSSWDDINDLVNKLNDSFTIDQLERYIEAFPKQQDSQKILPKSRSKVKPLSIAQVTPWRPGISEIQEYFDNNALRGYSMESHTMRQRVAMRLLRGCWQVELQDITDGIGQFEIHVRPKDLELLLLGPQSALDILHTKYLDLEHEKLEVFRSRGAIRVTTTNSKREWIVEQVKDSLNRIQQEKVPLRMLFPNLQLSGIRNLIERTFDDSTIRELARLADIRTVRLKHDSIDLSYIRRKDENSDHRISAARRLILMAGHIPQRINHRLASSGYPDGFFVSYPWVDGLNWWARLRKWYRHTAPITKDSITLEDSGKEESKTHHKITSISLSSQSRHPSHLDPQPREPNTKLIESDEKRKQMGTGPWQTQYYTRTSATMGAVLHNSASLGSVDIFRAQETPKDLINEFSTYVPHLSRLISASTIIKVGSFSHKLVLRFKPNPFQAVYRSGKKVPVGSDVFSAMPLIEMRFIRDPERIWKLNTVQAVVEETNTSVMLPEKAVDVRFEQRVTSRMRLEGIRQSVHSFLRKCVFDKDHMEIWPSLKLPIPQHLCRGRPLKIQNSLRYKNCQEIDYLFAEFELRRPLLMKYKDWVLSYTNISAGKSGGNRGELKLHPISKNKVMEENDFVELAYEVADVLGGTKEMIEEPVVARSVKSGQWMRKVKSDMDTPTYRYFPKRLNLGYFEDEVAANLDEEGPNDENEEEDQVPVTASPDAIRETPEGEVQADLNGELDEGEAHFIGNGQNEINNPEELVSDAQVEADVELIAEMTASKTGESSEEVVACETQKKPDTIKHS